MNPITLYTDVADFRSYTDGLQADTTLSQLAPSIRTAASDIKAVITAAVFDVIAAYTTASTDAEKEGKELLKAAIASGAMHKYMIFDAVKKNGSDSSLYKYQVDEIKQHHIEAYYRSMDELLSWLDTNNTTGSYNTSDQYSDRQALPLKSAAEFDKYYGIGGSGFFFHKIQYILKSIWEYKVKGLVGSSDDEKILELGKRILAYRTMAAAVLQFDATELPRSIRWDAKNEHASGSDMPERERLAQQLLSQAESWEKSLQVLTHNSGAAITSDQNREENKFYATL